MKHGNQKILASLANISEPRLSQILNGYSRPSYDLAKRLSEIVGETSIEIWMELDMNVIERALDRWNPMPEKKIA